MSVNQDFKVIATEYAAKCKEITELNRAVKELKNKKDEIGETLLSVMRTSGIDECQLPTGEKIIRKTSKRSSTLKPEMILNEFKEILGDDAKAEAALQNLQSKREVTEKETISFSASRGRVVTPDEDDD